MNIHPSLLRSFPGLESWRQAGPGLAGELAETLPQRGEISMSGGKLFWEEIIHHDWAPINPNSK